MDAIRISLNTHNAVLVDDFGDGVWLHTFTANGGMHVTLTKAQVQELIAALEQVIA